MNLYQPFLLLGTILRIPKGGGGLMLFELTTSILAGGLAGFSYFKKQGGSNDAIKIQRICNNNGLTVTENGKKQNMQLLRRSKIKNEGKVVGVEYAYRIPLGLSFKEFQDKKDHIQDGINNKQTLLDVSFQDLRTIQLDKNIIHSIKTLLNKKKTLRKEIELSYDGVLKIKVFNEPLETKVNWTDEMLKKGKWSVHIGSSRSGKVYHDFDKRKHLIIAGATGFGKSVIMKAIITQLIMSKPNDVNFSLIDLKGGPAFARFKDAKQVENFGTNNEEAKAILNDVQKNMESDYQFIVDEGYEDVLEAGITKRHFLVIDEAADLADNNAAMNILTDIVRKGRGAGYYVIYATQYPSSQAIPMQIKRNIPARICFVLDSVTASMTALDAPGAESLPEIPGRGIYKEVKQTIIQTPYMSNEQIRERIQPHVNIRPRKGEESETRGTKTTKGRKHTLIIEKTTLS